jgi:hypothetical protein
MFHQKYSKLLCIVAALNALNIVLSLCCVLFIKNEQNIII